MSKFCLQFDTDSRINKTPYSVVFLEYRPIVGNTGGCIRLAFVGKFEATQFQNNILLCRILKGIDFAVRFCFILDGASAIGFLCLDL